MEKADSRSPHSTCLSALRDSSLAHPQYRAVPDDGPTIPGQVGESRHPEVRFFESSKSFAVGAVGGKLESGEDFRGVWTRAGSFGFAKRFSRPISVMWKVTKRLRKYTVCRLTCRPRPMSPPQYQSMGFLRREFSNLVPRSGSDMCCLGASWAIPNFDPSD